MLEVVDYVIEGTRKKRIEITFHFGGARGFIQP